MANLITFGRLILLFVTIGLLYTNSYPVILSCVVLIAIVFFSDGLDGFVARRRKSTSEFGAIMDIAGDRVVENALWVVFAHLDLVGVWAPLMVLTRGFFVDAMRGIAYTSGKSAFGENSMARTPLTHFLTASRFMRAFYGAAKTFGFMFLTGLLAAQVAPESTTADLYAFDPFRYAGWFLVYSALALTVIRGVPVLVDAMFYISPSRGAAR